MNKIIFVFASIVLINKISLAQSNKVQTNNIIKMKVEIWSDVMCPFCYIGKRKFEQALTQFSHKDKIEVEWKSFELDPTLKTDPNTSIYQYLSKRKGWSLDQTKQISQQVVDMAKQVGLTYHMDKAVVANSFDAHRISHLAKSKGLQDQMEERLFSAYFTEGKNTGDQATLTQLGVEIGLNEADIKAMFSSDLYTNEVKQDEIKAQQVGARGVPFFVLDNKYAISGAQEPQTFLNALTKAYQEWLKENPAAITSIAEGAVCTPEGCD